MRFSIPILILAARLCLSGQEVRVSELIELLEKELPGQTREKLEQAAALGLAKELYPNVVLLTDSPAENDPAIAQSSLYNDGFAVIRFRQIRKGVAEELGAELKKIAGKKAIQGIILDLRFATGIDLAASVALADQFVGEKIPLIDLGDGPLHTTAKNEFLQMPVAVLINEETRAGAEVLAAILRKVRSALLLGAPTAGQARQMREVPLKGSARLLISGGPIQLAGTEMTGRIEPDIKIAVPLEQEREYVKDPFRIFAGNAGDARASRFLPPRTTEAELVRQLRESNSSDQPLAVEGVPKILSPPQLRDPVLVRALDVLKGLAVLQPRPAP